MYFLSNKCDVGPMQCALKSETSFYICLIVKYISQTIDTEKFAMIHCYLITLVRELVDIVALVRCWSNIGIPTPTFPPTTNVGNVFLLSEIYSSEIQENMDVI